MMPRAAVEPIRDMGGGAALTRKVRQWYFPEAKRIAAA